MIDLHCHILPGIDDGAKTIEDSIDMARDAVKGGITHVLATPHHMLREWTNEKTKVIKLVNMLQDELDSREIPLTIFPGQEVRLYGEIIEDIEKDKILFVDEQKQYLLIEFPATSIPHYTERLFYELQGMGITPIIVHPERNREVQEHPNRLKNLIDKGALSQLTAASYTGGFGKKIQKLSSQLVEVNMVQFIASDAHNITNRSFHMKEAYTKIEKEFGRKKKEEFLQTTKELINGDTVIAPTPGKVKAKKKFGLF